MHLCACVCVRVVHVRRAEVRGSGWGGDQIVVCLVKLCVNSWTGCWFIARDMHARPVRSNTRIAILQETLRGIKTLRVFHFWSLSPQLSIVIENWWFITLLPLPHFPPWQNPFFYTRVLVLQHLEWCQSKATSRWQFNRSRIWMDFKRQWKWCKTSQLSIAYSWNEKNPV